MNPFMWLYRDRASPVYSSVGVTANERPVLAREVGAVFARAGFEVSSHYLSGLAYRYVASARAPLAANLQFHRCQGVRPCGHGAVTPIRTHCRQEAVSRAPMSRELDIVIPVHNEGRNIVATLAGLAASLATPARVLICYDHDDDDTLPAIREHASSYARLPVELVRNR